MVRLATMTVAMAGVAIGMSAFAGDSEGASVTIGGIMGAVGLGLLIVTLSRLLVDRLDGRSAWPAVRWPVVGVWLIGSVVVATAGAADHVVVDWPRPAALLAGVLLFGSEVDRPPSRTHLSDSLPTQSTSTASAAGSSPAARQRSQPPTDRPAPVAVAGQRRRDWWPSDAAPTSTTFVHARCPDRAVVYLGRSVRLL